MGPTPSDGLFAPHTLHVVGRLLWVPWSIVPSAAVVAGIAGALGVRLRGSTWRVPKRWARNGHLVYSGMFGLALGTGFMTALPSIAMLVLYAWALVAPSWSLIWPVFLVFAVARFGTTIASVPLLARTGHIVTAVDRLRQIARPVRYGEVGLMLVVALVGLH
jgi:hypothetical protein